MILNLAEGNAMVLLDLVDAAAEALLPEIPSLTGKNRADAILYLQHLGVIKHRLEVNLDLSWFEGPSEWGYPLHGKPPKPYEGRSPIETTYRQTHRRQRR